MYKINLTNVKKEKSFYWTFFGAGFFFFSICTYAIVTQGFFGADLGGDDVIKENPIPFLLFCWIITVPFMWLGIKGIKNINNKIKRYKELARNGVLKKGFEYRLIPTGVTSNGNRIMKIAVEYELTSGSKVTLMGDERHDGKIGDDDGLVDILIDPNDPNNYFVDFNIEEDYSNRY